MSKLIPGDSADEPTVRLRHGTTKLRADAILMTGPDPDRVVGKDSAEGFSTAPTDGPFPLGNPEDYAYGKALLFPQEGGPAILEFDVPESVVAHAMHPGGEVWFGPGFGLKELLELWPQISKRVVIP